MSIFKSEGADLLKSFLPESYLIRRRNVWALSYKYEKWLGLESATKNRFWCALREASWSSPDRAPKMDVAFIKKSLGSLLVSCEPATFAAHDPKVPDAEIRYESEDALTLHVVTAKGAQHVRKQLADAAAYISRHEVLGAAKYVAGVTHPSMGRLAVALGFSKMELDYIDSFERDESYGIYLGYCAVNGRPAMPKQEYEPTVVYLPTEEFVQRFGAPEIAR